MTLSNLINEVASLDNSGIDDCTGALILGASYATARELIAALSNIPQTAYVVKLLTNLI